MKIGDEVYVHGYVDEIRKDCVIIRNEGGYFGTVESEIVYTIGDVRHGKWIRTGRTNVYGGYELECSVCGDKVMVQNIECELYCRKCGAKMDKSERKEE